MKGTRPKIPAEILASTPKEFVELMKQVTERVARKERE
jgi:hypothetical protein